MRIFAAALIAAGALFAAETLAAFGYTWTVPDAGDWSVAQEDGATVLRLVKPREPNPSPRRPIQFALAGTSDFGNVTVEADIKPLGHSVMVVFAYRDPAHFDYAHLSIDTATQEPHHNGIFHVYGGERVRISPVEGGAAFPDGNNRWYHVRLTREGSTGGVHVMVDGRDVPALHAVDLSLRSGKVGLGSFDETGEFKNVKIGGVEPRGHM